MTIFRMPSSMFSRCSGIGANRRRAPAGSVRLAPWLPILLAIHLLGALLCLGRTIRQRLRLRAMLGDATAPPDPDLLARYESLARRGGGRRRPRLLVSSRASSPLATGIIQPTIVLPDRLIPCLGSHEIDGRALSRACAPVAVLSDGFDGQWSPEAVSAAALFTRLVLGGVDNGAQTKARIDRLQGRLGDPASLAADLPLLHLGSYAMFQVGGEAWTSWRGATEKLLLERQHKDGAEGGSWDAPSGFEGGRVGATALGALALEVCTRYARLTR